jgi:hypothetical protein
LPNYGKTFFSGWVQDHATFAYPMQRVGEPAFGGRALIKVGLIESLKLEQSGSVDAILADGSLPCG